MSEFRVWHKPTKHMLYGGGLFGEDVMTLEGDVMHKDQLILTLGGDLCLYNCDRTYLYYTDEFIAMEYTGLKDNTKWEQLSKEEQHNWLWPAKGRTRESWNGKKIYEGDIVQFITHDGSGVVEYNAPTFKAGDFSLKGYECKVIGNIYTHPELLEV